MKKLLLAPLVLVLCNVYCVAQQDSTKVQKLEEVVVSDSRFQLKRENSGKTIIRITSEELEQNIGRSVAEIINTKSGIEINGSRSVAGQNLGYFIRGGNNRQVLVLIDGIQINDPSQIANDFDLRLLDSNTIESIEISKGAASTLYGNSAATAVINITTKKASKDGVSLSATTFFGTNAVQNQEGKPLANFTNSVSLNGSLKKLSYVVNFAGQYADGMSAAAENNAEEDPFSRIKTDVKLGYQFSENFKIDVFGGQSKFKTDIDGFPAPLFLFVDTDDRSSSNQRRVAIAPAYKYKNGSFAVNAGYLKIERETVSDFPSSFESSGFVVDAFNKYVFNDKWYTIIGFNHQKSEADLSEAVAFTTNDPYANMVYVSDFGLNLNIGGRLNNHSEYGSQFIYNFNPSYRFGLGSGYGKFFGSYSTSFIAPSLFQLFDATFGNAALNPEENSTLETGFEWNVGPKFRMSALYFQRNEENTVLFTVVDAANFISQYLNAEEDAKIQGAEIEVSSQLWEGLKVRANYSFNEFKAGNRVRLPKHRANANIAYQLLKHTNLLLNYQYVGSRTDTDFSTFGNVVLDPYSLWDLNLSREFKNGKLKVFAGVTNIFDTDYEEIIGYSTRGRNFNFGLHLNL